MSARSLSVSCHRFYFFFFRVYEKGVMVRLSGVRMIIGEEGVGEMGVGEMGISEVETILIMYNTYVLYPMFSITSENLGFRYPVCKKYIYGVAHSIGVTFRCALKRRYQKPALYCTKTGSQSKIFNC